MAPTLPLSLRRCRTAESTEVCLADWRVLIKTLDDNGRLAHSGPALCGRSVVQTLRRGICVGDEDNREPVSCATCRAIMAEQEHQDARLLAGVA